MINIPPIPPSQVQKTYIAEKDPQQRQKREEKQEDEVEDKITISAEPEAEEQKKKPPENPIYGHIDIEI